MMKKWLAVLAGAAALTAACEDVTLSVASGTQSFSAAMTANGYSSFPQDGVIVKTGLGMLTASSDASVNSVLAGFRVEAGAFNVTSHEQFGSTSFRGEDGHFYVDDEATLYFSGSSCVLIGQVVHIKGSGAASLGATAMSENGAIAIANNVYAYGATYVLDGDATMMNIYGARHAQMFGGNWAAAWRNWASIDLGSGHTLTLANTATARTSNFGFLFRGGLGITGSGKIVMDHAPLVQDSDSFVVNRDAGTTVELVLSNSAPFRITSPDVAKLFDNIRVLSGSVIEGIAAGDITVDVDGISGAGAVGAGISTLGITKKLSASVADMTGGAVLSVTNEVSFAAGSKVVIEGDASVLATADGAEYAVLRAEGGISGMPTVAGEARRHFRLRKSADGRTLKLVYADPKPAGAVDVVADWGLVEGSPSDASSNAATFNARIGQATTGSTVYFPAGDYYFSAPLAVNGRGSVVITGDGGASVIHGPGEANVMTVANSSDVTITRIALDNCTGPAVAASGTTRLSISNILYSAVGGAVEGEEGRYPLSVANGAVTYVRHNRVTDGATYASPVFLDEGTTAVGSEPLDRDVNYGILDIWVDEGDEEGFYEALAKAGYASWPAMTRLLKSGPGILVATNNLTGSLRGITIEQGVMRFSFDNDIGVSGYGVVVSNGATAVCMPRMHVANRPIYISGEGASGMGGALVAEGLLTAGNMSVRLAHGDATMVARYRGSVCTMLAGGGSETSSSTLLGGNSLTLRAENGCTGIGTNYKLIMRESGKIVMDGTMLTDVTSDSSTKYAFSADAGANVTVKLINGASFKPKFTSWVSMFSGIEAEEGTAIDSGSASLSLPLTFADFAGLPTLGANITSLSVTNRFSVDAADLVAGRHFAADCPVAFGVAAKVALKDPSGAFAAVGGNFCCPFVESTVSLSGSPAKDRAASDVLAWSLDCPAGAQFYNIIPPQGFVIQFH